MLVCFNRLFIVLAISVSHTLIAGNKNPGQKPDVEMTTPYVKKLIKATDILDFNAISDGKRVYVNWASGNQKNYDYYTVEKAKDGIHFEAAAMIKGAGSGNSLVDYTDIDYSPYTGISYYRLKQTDYAGNESYSDMVRVNYQFSKDGTIISCQSFDPIDNREMDKKEILVVLRDVKGEEYVSKIVLSDSTTGLYAIDPKSRLKQGTYKVMASSFNRLFSQDITIR